MSICLSSMEYLLKEISHDFDVFLSSQSDITYDESEDDSDDDYGRRAAPPSKKKANFKRTPAKSSSAKKGRGRPPAKAAAKGRGRPPAKAKGKKKASKYYDSEDDVVYRYVANMGLILLPAAKPAGL